MKILVVGNHTCGNRGDGAILRGLVDSLQRVNQHAQIDIISRYPVSSTYLAQRQIDQDPLFLPRRRQARGIVGKLCNNLLTLLLPTIMLVRLKGGGWRKHCPVPRYLLAFAETCRQYDLIIQVGGSFFVDLYGIHQFEHAFCALLAKKPIYLLGHSVGPFQQTRFRRVANAIFSRVDALVLRETVSAALLTDANITPRNLQIGVDTAFLVRPQHVNSSSYSLLHWQQQIERCNTIAITVRNLAPFDRRLGITQAEYELAWGQLINRLIASGYQVIALSTCTGIDSYGSDDRMVALRVQQHVACRAGYQVVMDEFNDIELGLLLQKCRLVVGTRLHSAIIAMTFGTPAIAINYEHKSRGVMQQLGLPQLACEPCELIEETLERKIITLLADEDALRQALVDKIDCLRAQGDKLIQQVLAEQSATLGETGG